MNKHTITNIHCPGTWAPSNLCTHILQQMHKRNKCAHKLYKIMSKLKILLVLIQSTETLHVTSLNAITLVIY